MTRSSSADEIEYLATEIITNSKPVSYHKFSRQLNIHVSKAKATLLEYYQKNKNDLTAAFIVTGRNDNGKLIKLSNEDDLESDLKKFTTVHCVHVYSVHKKLIQFSNNELALEELKHPSSLNKISEYEKNGIIIGPKIEKVIPVNIPSSPVKPEPSHKNKPTEEKKSSSSLLSSYVSRKQEKKQQATRSGTLSNYVSRKTEPTIPSKRSNTEPATKPTYQYKSRKLEAKAPKERVIIAENNDNEDEEDDDDDKPIKASRATNTSDLQRMFDGDDFTFSDDDESPEKEVRETEEPKDEDKKDILPESPKEEQQSKEVNPENEPGLFVNEEEEEEEEQKEQEETPAGEQEEFITEKDEEGYLITRKVKPITKQAKPKKQVAPPKVTKPSTGKKTGMKQSSLMSFFGKKK